MTQICVLALALEGSFSSFYVRLACLHGSPHCLPLWLSQLDRADSWQTRLPMLWPHSPHAQVYILGAGRA